MEDQRVPQAREVDPSLHLNVYSNQGVICGQQGQCKAVAGQVPLLWDLAQVLSQLLTTPVCLCVLGLANS